MENSKNKTSKSLIIFLVLMFMIGLSGMLYFIYDSALYCAFQINN